VDLAEEDLRVTQERYEVGLATVLDLQASQITLRQAEVDLIQRRFDYALGIAQIEGLVGRSLQ
jgi:outer membrane protein TolC